MDFRSYKLIVDGAVERRHAFPLAELQHMGEQTQITRHDCVEGWSAIGKWSGVRLADVLAAVTPRPDAKYVVFHCLDNDGQGNLYYESLDLAPSAATPQALLATMPQRRAARPCPRRARSAARADPTRLQEREVGRPHRDRRQLGAKILAAAAATGKTRATSGNAWI